MHDNYNNRENKSQYGSSDFHNFQSVRKTAQFIHCVRYIQAHLECGAFDPHQRVEYQIDFRNRCNSNEVEELCRLWSQNEW